MLLFTPWRNHWAHHIPDELKTMDDLVTLRNEGRYTPPRINWNSKVKITLKALKLSEGRVDSFSFFNRDIVPILVPCLWPRWLLLEEALSSSASQGDLLTCSIILRTQIEELDALRVASRLLSAHDEKSWKELDSQDDCAFLLKRLLPRFTTKNDDEIKSKSTDLNIGKRSDKLHQMFINLCEYMHPNYGSHILSVRPDSVDAALVLVTAFNAIYEEFLSYPWAQEKSKKNANVRPDSSLCNNPFDEMIDSNIPKLKYSFLDKKLGDETDWEGYIEKCKLLKYRFDSILSPDDNGQISGHYPA